MSSEEIKVTIKHKIVAFIIVSILLVAVSFFVYFLTKKSSEIIDLQPAVLKQYMKTSFTLTIANNTNKLFKLNNLTIGEDVFINIEYFKNKSYVMTASGLLIYKDKKINLSNISKADSDAVSKFVALELPHCIVNNSIKNVFSDKSNKNGLLISFENDLIDISITLYKESDNMKLYILENLYNVKSRVARTTYGYQCSENNKNFIDKLTKAILAIVK